MTFTWGDIQVASIQKMFLNNTVITTANLPTMKTEDKYKIYFNAMPFAANEGILRLMANARPRYSSYEITQYVVTNLLGDMKKTLQHTDEDITYEAEAGLSYYFEVDNLATVKIYVNDVLVDTITNATRTPGIFTAYKDFLTNTTDTVKIVFSGDHPYNYRNVAIYGEDFDYDSADADTIPDYGHYTKYLLTTLIPSFYRLEAIYYEGGSKPVKLETEYRLEKDNVLYLDSSKTGNYRIVYQAYPTKITSSTSDTAVLELEPEVAVLLPLYIASELYKDDDPSLSTVYRNQFEVGLEKLYRPNNSEEFVDTKGWI